MLKSKTKFLPSLKKIKTSSKIFSEDIKNILLQTFKHIPIGITPMNELQIKWNDDEDLKQIKFILQDILQYPSSDMADIHRDSNRLGTFDLLQNHDLLQRMIMEDDEPQIYCECCGYLLQRGQIPVKTSFKNVINIGVSTILYFQTLINLSVMLIVLFLLYGVFSLVTNVIAYQNFPDREQFLSNSSFLIISLSPKQLNKTEENMNYYFIQCWLGLVTVIVWFFMFLGIKFFQRNDEILINSKTISAADFSVVIEGVPTTLKKQDMQKQLDLYYNQLTEEQKPQLIDRPFKIAKYNAAVPFYLTIDQFMGNQLKKIIKQKKQLRELFAKWILDRQTLQQFQIPKAQRVEFYQRYQKIQSQIEQKYQIIVKRIVNEMNRNYNKNPTTSVYITFESSYSKQLFCRLNTPQDTLQRTKKKFWCCHSQHYFDIEFQQQKFLTNVQRAPQPQDIIWTNIGQTLKEMTLRKIGTYSVTAIILGASFVIFFFLSKEQVKNDSDVLLSFVISASITIFNIIIQIAIRLLTQTQRQITQTNFQTGLALKSIIAQLINSIVLTFVIKHDLQHNIYKTDGLAYVVFSMGITNSFITPLLKIFDLNIILQLIKGWYYKKPTTKMSYNQNQLNLKFTFQQFEVGYQYIYPANLFLFICFFVSLQPIICIFGIIGLFLMFWVQKYVLFNRCKRPFPGNDTINRAIYRVLYFGPLIFSLGNLTWSNLLTEGGPQTAIIPNLISIGLSSVFVLVPNKYFFSKILAQVFEKELIYQEERIFLPSQYDRLNPATAKKAMPQYYNFLKDYKKKIKNQSEQKVLAIQQMMVLQKQRGQLGKSDLDRIFWTFDVNSIENVLKKKDKFINEQEEEKNDGQQSNDHVQAEENYILIKQNSIQQLQVKKKCKKKKLVNSEKLFKELFFNQKNVFQFIQNWTENNEKPPQQQINFLTLFLPNTKKKQLKDTTSIQEENGKKKQFQTAEKANQVNPKSIIQLLLNNIHQKHLTYDIIKQLFSEHQNKQQVQNQKRGIPQAEKQNQLRQNQEGTRQGFMDLVVHSGQVHPTSQKV